MGLAGNLTKKQTQPKEVCVLTIGRATKKRILIRLCFSTGVCVCCAGRCVVVVRGVGGALHPAAGGRLQPHVSRAFPLQQRHRWTQTQRFRRRLHRLVW